MEPQENTRPTAHDAAETPAVKTYAPALTFYHANSKGTGSAVQFELRPATADREGCWFMSMAAQKSIGQGANAEGGRKNATFAWSEKITAKLNFADLSAMLMVFAGKEKSLGDGKGLYHDSADFSTIISLAEATGDFPGFSLELSKKQKHDGALSRVRLLLRPPEAFGLARLISGTLPRIAFG